MDLISYMQTKEYKDLAAQYEEKFNSDVPTYIFMSADDKEIKQVLKESIKSNKSLIESNEDIYY